MKIPMTITGKVITLFVDGENRSFAKGSELYEPLLAAIKRGDEKAINEIVHAKRTVVSQSEGLVELRDDVIYYDGAPMHSVLTDRIVSGFKRGQNIQPLLKFLNNLKENPSKRAVDELFTFLEKSNLPITADGHFVAYKMVRKDFKDKHSGTFDNSPGKVCKMRRNEVDDDKRNTCSNGLHFASREYLGSGFGNQSNGDRLIAVKINPADVVSIPIDYNNSKGRTCEYLVLKEIRWDEEIDLNWTPDGNMNTAPAVSDEPDESEESDETSGRGENNSNAKLSEADVRQIRKLLNDEEWTLTAVAKAYDISRRTAARIRDREIWTHVK